MCYFVRTTVFILFLLRIQLSGFGYIDSGGWNRNFLLVATMLLALLLIFLSFLGMLRVVKALKNCQCFSTLIFRFFNFRVFCGFGFNSYNMHLLNILATCLANIAMDTGLYFGFGFGFISFPNQDILTILFLVVLINSKPNQESKAFIKVLVQTFFCKSILYILFY